MYMWLSYPLPDVVIHCRSRPCKGRLCSGHSHW